VRLILAEYYYGSRTWAIGFFVILVVGFVWKLLTSRGDDSDDEG